MAHFAGGLLSADRLAVKPLHRAAEHLGRLLRTLFRCDYIAIEDFRREIHTVVHDRAGRVGQYWIGADTPGLFLGRSGVGARLHRMATGGR